MARLASFRVLVLLVALCFGWLSQLALAAPLPITEYESSGLSRRAPAANLQDLQAQKDDLILAVLEVSPALDNFVFYSSGSVQQAEQLASANGRVTFDDIFAKNPAAIKIIGSLLTQSAVIDQLSEWMGDWARGDVWIVDGHPPIPNTRWMEKERGMVLVNQLNGEVQRMLHFRGGVTSGTGYWATETASRSGSDITSTVTPVSGGGNCKRDPQACSAAPSSAEVALAESITQQGNQNPITAPTQTEEQQDESEVTNAENEVKSNSGNSNTNSPSTGTPSTTTSDTDTETATDTDSSNNGETATNPETSTDSTTGETATNPDSGTNTSTDSPDGETATNPDSSTGETSTDGGDETDSNTDSSSDGDTDANSDDTDSDGTTTEGTPKAPTHGAKP